MLRNFSILKITNVKSSHKQQLYHNGWKSIFRGWNVFRAEFFEDRKFNYDFSVLQRIWIFHDFKYAYQYQTTNSPVGNMTSVEDLGEPGYFDLYKS